MEEIFSQLAEEESGKYAANDSVFSELSGARTSHSVYLLNFEYKRNKIIVKNELGAKSYGILQLNFKLNKELPSFSIETKNHFLSLFSKKKETFTVKSNNESLVNFIALNKNILLLQEIAKMTKFEPVIVGQVKGSNYSITTEYSLLFKERKAVLRPLIQFYKELFDYL